MLGESRTKADKRNSAGIHGYVGANGDGKTLAMVHDAMPLLDDGMPALGTVRIRDWRSPCLTCGGFPRCTDTCDGLELPDHPLWTPLTSLDQLLEFREGVVMLDEVQGIFSAREHQGMPYQVANALRKMRHADLAVKWTAPDWMAPDAVLRRVTKAVTKAKGKHGSDHYKMCPACGEVHKRPKKDCGGRASPVRLWKDNRTFVWKTYDARDFDEYTESAGKKLKTICGQIYRRPRGLAQRAYDTYGEVLSLGHADEHGVCIVCGGIRRRKPCPGHGPDDQGDPAPVRRKDAERLGLFDLDRPARNGFSLTDP